MKIYNSTDLEECIEVIDEKTHHTKWKKADITDDIIEHLKSNGYWVYYKIPL